MSELTAVGPQGLIDTLTQLQAGLDSASSPQHFILYRNGDQKALLLVDTLQAPYQFFHYDLDGRAANIGFRLALTDFCRKAFKIQDVGSVLQDVSRAHLMGQQKGFFEGGAMVQDQDERTMGNARRHLEEAYAKFCHNRVVSQPVQPTVSTDKSSISRWKASLNSLFGKSEASAKSVNSEKLDNPRENKLK